MTKDNSQLRAIRASATNSALIIAPPGYGKTHVMARRIEYLMTSRVLSPPQRLLGLTFTNAAADEMRQRVLQNPLSNNNIDLMTFHSFCYQVLRAYGTYVSVKPEFSVISENESRKRNLAVFKKLGLKQDYEGYKNWLRRHLLESNDVSEPSTYLQIYEGYIISCQQEDKVDFDHLLEFTRKLFIEHPRILEIYRATYSYILVDEFQDTNPLQFTLLSLLAEGVNDPKKESNAIPVFIFGDKHQSIYEFLGATPENIDRGVEKFNCKTYRLEKNHRTDSRKILELTSALRQDIPTLPSSQPTVLHIHSDVLSEAEAIREDIIELKLNELPLHEICVIAPWQSRTDEIRKKLAEDEPIPYLSIQDYSGTKIEDNLPNLFARLRTLNRKNASSLGREIRHELESETDDGKKLVLQLLLNMAVKYDSTYRKESIVKRAALFLNDVLLEVNWGQLISQHVKGKVLVSTIHGVKGMEFKHVIICGVEKGLLPYFSICDNLCKSGKFRAEIDEHLAEAMRLFYVGISRSTHDLSIHYTKQNSYGYPTKPTCLLEYLRSHVSSTSGWENSICGY